MNINDLRKYCHKHDIIVRTYQNSVDSLEWLNLTEFAKRYKGFTYRHSEEMLIIFYDDNLSESEKLFVFAHEIGHCVMNHLKKQKEPEPKIEMEADVFACVFTALNVFEEIRGAVTS